MRPLSRPARQGLALLRLLLFTQPTTAQQPGSITGTIVTESGAPECCGPLLTDWAEPTECAFLTLGLVTDPHTSSGHPPSTTDHWVFRGGHPAFPTQSLSCMPPRTTPSPPPLPTPTRAPGLIPPVYYTATAPACPGGWSMATSRALGNGTSSGKCCASGYTLPANGFALCVSPGCGAGTAAAYATGQGGGGPPTLVLQSTTVEWAICAATGMPIEVRWVLGTVGRGDGAGNGTGNGTGSGDGGGETKGALTTGGKAALGVVLPLVVIALGILAWVMYRRRKAKEAAPQHRVHHNRVPAEASWARYEREGGGNPA